MQTLGVALGLIWVAPTGSGLWPARWQAMALRNEQASECRNETDERGRSLDYFAPAAMTAGAGNE
jgi:hypothetical protein